MIALVLTVFQEECKRLHGDTSAQYCTSQPTGSSIIIISNKHDCSINAIMWLHSIIKMKVLMGGEVRKPCLYCRRVMKCQKIL